MARIYRVVTKHLALIVEYVAFPEPNIVAWDGWHNAYSWFTLYEAKVNEWIKVLHVALSLTVAFSHALLTGENA